MKILSPVGNFESLKAAIYSGADEVYLGVNEFNARNNIDGFNLENLFNAVSFAHLFGVKVALAINILFSDCELEDALKVAVTAYNAGVDALIVQDLGLIKLLSTNYPEIELHASTQMGIHNLEGVRAIEKYGFKRVVLSRETPLSEIKRIKENTDIEIEYFAQGALCVSFSGNCYLSSYLFGASGNRGRCKQPCRLPYTLVKGGKVYKKGYLLSAKDFNMLGRLSDLKAAGVDVIKIEGRARRPYYVAAATKAYYNALNGKSVEKEELELGFNRTYTEGYFNGNGKIISEIQGHIGIWAGRIEKVKYGKKFNEVFLSSTRELKPKSTFKIFGGGVEKTTLTAYDLIEVKKGLYRLTTTHNLSVGDQARLIADFNKETWAQNLTPKKQVEINIFAEDGAPIRAVTRVDDREITVLGCVCERAKSKPITEQEIKENFSKSETFDAKICVKQLDEVFILKKDFNEFRRNVFSEIYSAKTEKYKRNLSAQKIKKNYSVIKFTDFQTVKSVDESFIEKNVIYSPEEYILEDVLRFKNKCETLNKKAYLDTPNFALKEDIDLLKNIIEKSGVGIIANNYYALTLSSNVVIGAGLNVYNKCAAEEFSLPVITAESDISSRVDYPYMTLRHCPIKAHINSSCNKCAYEDGFKYITDSGKELKLKRKKLSTCTFYLTD